MSLKCIILYGGDAVEYNLSLQSAIHVASLLKAEGWHVQLACFTPHPGKRHPSHIYLSDTVSIREKAEQLALLQGDVLMNLVTGPLNLHRQNEILLRLVEVPVVGNSIEVQQITRNKYVMKCLMMELGIKTPAFAFLRSEHELSVFLSSLPFSLPHILKPVDGGSSHDVVLIDNVDSLVREARRQMELNGSVLVEEFVRGVDMSAGACGSNPISPTALPLIEIRHNNKIFDARSKSTVDYSLVPVGKQLSGVSAKAKKACIAMHQKLNCMFYSRMDFIRTEKTLYGLECNGSPGLSSYSLIPSMYKASGKSMAEALNDMLANASTI